MTHAHADPWQEERTRVRQVRLQLLDLHPFWGHLLLQLEVVPAPRLGAIAATDCVRTIWFDPVVTRHLTLPQLGFVLAHELGHVVLKSAERRRDRRTHAWNCATDYAINRIVAGIRRPGPRGEPLYAPPSGTIPGLGDVRILLDARWDGMAAEAIYECLDDDDLPSPAALTVRLPLEVGSSGEGSPDELTLPDVADHGGGIDVHLPRTLDGEDLSEVRDRLASAARAWAEDQRRGDLPGEVLRAIDGDTPARVPWERELARILDAAAGRDELDYRRPSRRHLLEGFIAPGRVPGRPGSVVVALDTSASISPDVLSTVTEEVRALRERVADLTLIVADAAIQAVVRSDDLDRFLRRGRAPGGGGTDHRPVFGWMEEHMPRPALFVGLTDLWTRLPSRRPEYPVLWITPERHGPAPWGRLLELP